MATVKFPRDVFEAEVKIGDGFHVILRAAHTAIGPVTRVYNAKTGKWIEPEWAGDINDAKATAEKIARGLYTSAHVEEKFPPVEWQKIDG